MALLVQLMCAVRAALDMLYIPGKGPGLAVSARPDVLNLSGSQ